MKRGCAARLRNCAPRASRRSQFVFCSLISIPPTRIALARSSRKSARGFPHHLVLDRAAVQGVRTLHYGELIGVHRAEGVALHRAARERAQAGGDQWRTAHHGVERRRRHPRDGRRQAGAYAVVGPGRRRSRRRLGRRTLQARKADHLRYRRHQRRHRSSLSAVASPRPTRARRRSAAFRCLCR